jgi:D-alanyl-D-alanine dipeptidase
MSQNSDLHHSHLNPHTLVETAVGEPPADAALTLPQIDHFGEHLDDLIKVPIIDNGEPLVDVFQVCPELSWMTESLRFDFPRSGLGRESLAFMLRDAQSLLPRGLRFQIVGVFRSFAIQKQMYEIVCGEMREKHPEWSEEFLSSYVNVFSAPPVLTTPPPHTTGGAVDLSIIDANGERLDMISPFEMGWDSAPMDMLGLSETARRNRDLMRGILLEVGLTNFPGEWWHWSYGEPGWALRGGHSHALYGAVPEDQIPDWQEPS